MENQKKIHAIKVHQWLDEWENYEFDPKTHRSRPEPYFLIFSMDANELRSLSGIYQRTTKDGLQRSLDLGIQRRHDPERSKVIHDFIQSGYPWTEISKSKRDTGKYDDLRKPGWLPTAIVVNILKPDQIRRGLGVAPKDLITLEHTENEITNIFLPQSYTNKDWQPTQRHPIEIIDGQHRLFAFDEKLPSGKFELPVVAFYGLDISWQAYLFWTINITPKRINPSMAFDLYPLLRTEDWLEKFEGPVVYRQTRAQELVEALWSFPKSPWYQRINMLGETGQKTVSQAAWIHSLLATFVKAWEGRGSIGGLYGAKIGSDDTVLSWDGAQQAAFLIFAWQLLAHEIKSVNYDWASTLRGSEHKMVLMQDENRFEDLAFSGADTLLNTDQGVRGVLYIVNDMFYLQAKQHQIDLESWGYKQELTGNLLDDIAKALELLENEEQLKNFMSALAKGLAKFDWRTANFASLSVEERTAKLVFRGSGGYKELRRQLLKLLNLEPGEIGKTAQLVMKTLRYK